MDQERASPVAAITGASSGIGAATARLLGEQGWTTVLIARGREGLEEVADEIRARGGAAVVEALDAADGAAVLAMAVRVERQLGTPLAIVNCAGAGRWRFLEETAPEEVVDMMAAPFFAAANLSRAFLPAMLERRRGVLVHVSSPASRFPWPGCTGYAASRWALRGLHEALCQDLRGTGVSTCQVVFGEVSSPYFAHNPGSREHLPGIARIIRVLEPEECARVIARAIRQPRRQVVHPFVLRAIYWTGAVAPALVRWLVGATGRRH